MDERIERARELYEQAIFGISADAAGAAGAVDARDGLAEADRGLDAVEADLALARGRLMHGRFLADRQEDPGELPLFERALELYRSLGDEGGEVEALFWLGCFHQVVRGDNEAAVPVLTQARDLAARIGDDLTLSYILRHLGIAEHTASRLDEARALLEESTQLRRDLNLQPGVAANLVGLIYIARAQGRSDDARALADEGVAIAESSGATTILQQLTEARAGL